MTTTSNVLYASQARPWLKYYDPNYIDQPMPECSAFDFVRQQNKNRLSETALEYYGRKFTYADLIVNTKKTAAAFRAAGVRKGDIITVVSVMTPEVIYAFYAADRIGAIECNGLFGIFGTLDAPPDGTPVETAPANAVKTGSATILSTVAGDTVQAYTVNITRVYHDGASTRFAITVTDPALLAATGGIVQGMSGSPILQGGRLVGAVTHVLLSDPAKGYGVSIDDMLAAAQAA